MVAEGHPDFATMKVLTEGVIEAREELMKRGKIPQQDYKSTSRQTNPECAATTLSEEPAMEGENHGRAPFSKKVDQNHNAKNPAE